MPLDLAELELLHGAERAFNADPKICGAEWRKARNELLAYLEGHIPAILAMGAECERLRGELGALAARQARIQAIAEEPDTLLVNPAADDSQSRKRMMKIRGITYLTPHRY